MRTLLVLAVLGLGCNVDAKRDEAPPTDAAGARADAHETPTPVCQTTARAASPAVDPGGDPMPAEYAELYQTMDASIGRWPAFRYLARREAVHEHSISFLALALADMSCVGPDGRTDADHAIRDMRRIADENPFGFTDEQRGRLRKIADQFQAVADAGRAIDGDNVDAFLSATNPPPAPR